MKFMQSLAVTLLCLAAHAAFAQAATEAERQREDIAQFRREFFDIDRSYSHAARREGEQRLAELEKTVGTVEPVAFGLALARIAALADNGHTLSFAAPRSRRLERADVRLTPFGDQFYVLRVKAENADLLGARLTSIDGVPMDALRKLYRSLSGGTDAWRDRSAAYFLESPPQLRALGVGKGPAAPVYAFTTLDGKAVERSFTVSPAGADRVGGNATRWMFPVLAPLEDRAWKTLLDAERAPWSLQEPVKRLRVKHDAALNAVILDMRQSNNSAEEKLKDYFAAAETLFEQVKPAHLVLDLRLNGGGDLTTTRDFAERLPMLVQGRIFALTSPWTFSAAISTLGYLKQTGRERVTIVGEPVGDRLEFFAEGRPVTLKHSQEGFLFARERHDYRNGCAKFDDCHRQVVVRPIAVPSLDPDIAAPWTIDDYRAGRDPAMEAVARVLAGTK
ncbi:MAG TPA: hypothetical protein VFV17_01205 [Usitatibacteraceae bacterium]|nr:hypothetical protein [Usitatibacteraceae bacterium]